MAEENINEEKRPPSRSQTAKVGIFFSILAILIFVCAFSYGYFQLSQVNLSLANMISDLKQESTKHKENILTLHQSIEKLTQTVEKSAALSSQQEKLMSDWNEAQKGNLGKWQVAESQYLVKLANDQLQFTYNVPLAMLLLQRANDELGSVPDGIVTNIHQAIQNDLNTLKNTPQVDISKIYTSLLNIDKQIEQLPLPTLPLKPETAPLTLTVDEPWWKKGLNHSWDVLKQVIVVRYNENSLPFIGPDEKTMLYQNLHAEMQSAIWGLLNRKTDVFQSSVTRVMNGIQKYFVQDDSLTKSVLRDLAELQSVNLAPPALNLNSTLSVFNQYFQSSTPQSAAP